MHLISVAEQPGRKALGLFQICVSSTLPSVGTLVGGWEVEGGSLPTVPSLLLNVVLATIVVLMG